MVQNVPKCFKMVQNNSSFVEISSEHLHYQTVKARELQFWEKVHLPQPVLCHMSRVTCHVSPVTCHVSHVTCHYFSNLVFLLFVVKLVGGLVWFGGSVINEATSSSFHIIQDTKLSLLVFSMIHYNFHHANDCPAVLILFSKATIWIFKLKVGGNHDGLHLILKQRSIWSF